MNIGLIAPCGMNCNLCIAFLRAKNNCPGCRKQNELEYCRKCIIKNCKTIKKNKWKFCSNKCEIFPCARLKALDKRYRTKYEMSMIDNLKFINSNGIRKFIKHEKQRWMQGDKIYCVHKKEFLRK